MVASALRDLGWTDFFSDQLEPAEATRLAPARLTEVHRDHVLALTGSGTLSLTLPAETLSTADVTVGDWALFEPESRRIARRLDRKSLLRRRAAGTEPRDQLIAANIDTLFITSSMNDDFNPARLERFLALAHGAGVRPVLVLTRADLAGDPAPWLAELEAIAPDVPARALDATNPDAARALLHWCGPGETAAFVGSSGVGKSTLIAALTGAGIATGAIREDDGKGRHTTTNRTLYRVKDGGWVIDTPGMRALRLTQSGAGIDAVFSDLATLAETCRFRDCAHESEPGCAVQAAIASGEVSAERLMRWRKLSEEDARNSARSGKPGKAGRKGGYPRS